MGATVIGVSADTIEVLDKFSLSECRSKFAVAADGSLAIAKAYDAVLLKFTSKANRTSYVITPDFKIIAVHSDLNPDRHVEITLAAVKNWVAQTGAGKNNHKI